MYEMLSCANGEDAPAIGVEGDFRGRNFICSATPVRCRAMFVVKIGIREESVVEKILAQSKIVSADNSGRRRFTLPFVVCGIFKDFCDVRNSLLACRGEFSVTACQTLA
jgi:hypothetical protein